MFRWAVDLKDNSQRKLVRFALQRSIGQFLERPLQLDQIDFNVKDGHFRLGELDLNTAALNELAADLPLRVVAGRLRNVQGHIPYLSLTSDSCEFQLDGVSLTVEPARRAAPASPSSNLTATSFFELSRSISADYKHDMASGESDNAPEVADTEQGIEQLALLIRAIFARIKGSVCDVTLRLQLPAVALVLQVAAISYVDTSEQSQAASATFDPAAAAVAEKEVRLRGVCVSVELADGLLTRGAGALAKSLFGDPVAGRVVQLLASAAQHDDVIKISQQHVPPRLNVEYFAQNLQLLLSPNDIEVFLAAATAFTHAQSKPPPSALSPSSAATTGAAPAELQMVNVSVVARVVGCGLLFDDVVDSSARVATATRHFASVAAQKSSAESAILACGRELLWIHLRQPRVAIDAAGRLNASLNDCTLSESWWPTPTQGKVCRVLDFSERVVVPHLRTPEGMLWLPAAKLAEPAQFDGPAVEVDIAPGGAAGPPHIAVRVKPATLTVDPTLLDRLFCLLAVGGDGDPRAPYAPPNVTVDCAALRIILAIPVPPFPPPLPSLHARGRPSKPKLRPIALHLFVQGVAVVLAAPARIPANDPQTIFQLAAHPGLEADSLTKQFVHASATGLTAFLVPSEPAQTASFLVVEATPPSPLIVQIHLRTPRLSAPATRQHSAAPQFGPFSAQSTTDFGRDQGTRPANVADGHAFQTAGTAGAEICLYVNLPAVTCHLRQDSFVALYKSVIDLSMFSPWRPADLGPLHVTPEARALLPHAAAACVCIEQGTVVLEDVCASRLDGSLCDGGPVPAPATHTARLEIDLSRARIFALAGCDGQRTNKILVQMGDFSLHSRLGVEGNRVLLIDRHHAPTEAKEDRKQSLLGCMLSVGVEIRLDESHGGAGRKVMTTALDLSRLKVHHRCSADGRHWLFRLLNFVDLQTHAYAGLVEPTSVAALTVHFWDTLLQFVHGWWRVCF